MALIGITLDIIEELSCTRFITTNNKIQEIIAAISWINSWRERNRHGSLCWQIISRTRLQSKPMKCPFHEKLVDADICPDFIFSSRPCLEAIYFFSRYFVMTTRYSDTVWRKNNQKWQIYEMEDNQMLPGQITKSGILLNLPSLNINISFKVWPAKYQRIVYTGE